MLSAEETIEAIFGSKKSDGRDTLADMLEHEPVARYILVEKSKDGDLCATMCNSATAALEYHIFQEGAYYWEIVGILDRDIGGWMGCVNGPVAICRPD